MCVCVCVCVCVLGHFSHVQLFVTIWTVARQAPLSMGFSRPEKKSSPTTSPVLAFLHGPGECEGSLRVGSQQGREEQASPQHFRVPSWAPLTGLMSKLRPREGRMAPQGHMAVWK